MVLIILPFIFISASLYPSEEVMQRINEWENRVKVLKDSFNKIPANIENKEWTKKKLAHLVDLDQSMQVLIRHGFSLSDEKRPEFWHIFQPKGRMLTVENTEAVKELLQQHYWFIISKYGQIADWHAWLLVQHASHDRAFSEEILGRLARLYPLKETNPALSR